jgi:hypothetical protein
MSCKRSAGHKVTAARDGTGRQLAAVLASDVRVFFFHARSRSAGLAVFAHRSASACWLLFPATLLAD